MSPPGVMAPLVADAYAIVGVVEACGGVSQECLWR
jgi:hypothetical protein